MRAAARWQILQQPFSADQVLFFLIAALGAVSLVIKGYAAAGTAAVRGGGGKLRRSGIVAAGEGQFDDVEFVFQKGVDDLDHAFDGHGFLCHHHPAFRVGGRQFCFESGALHGVPGGTVAYALCFIDLQDGLQKGIIFPQDQCVVKVLQYVPCGFADLVAWKDHVDSRIDTFFHFDGQCAGVSVEILCFALKAEKPVGILQMECGKAPHLNTPPQ